MDTTYDDSIPTPEHDDDNADVRADNWCGHPERAVDDEMTAALDADGCAIQPPTDDDTEAARRDVEAG